MSDEEDKGKNHIASSITGLILIGFVSLFWSDIWPWTFTSVWKSTGSVTDWLIVGSPAFLWALSINFFFDILRKRSSRERQLLMSCAPKQILGAGFVRSLWAGVSEELTFRWILPYAAVPTLLLTNWVFFGWAGWGFNEWFHTTLWSPFANLATVDYLQPFLLAENWVIGACILYTNAFFRDGHKYQGLLGWINSWFMGMYLWFVALNYGLVAAIFIHFLYDFIIYTYAASSVWVRQMWRSR